jgi:hypothetical protein
MIAKEKTSHKIDVVVALAMAALGAVEGQATTGSGVLFDPTPIAPDGTPLQTLVGPYAMSPLDSFASHLERLPEW